MCICRKVMMIVLPFRVGPLFRTLNLLGQSMRAAGHSFRNAARFSHSQSSWKKKNRFSATNKPTLRWVWSTLFWLPTFTVLTQVGCTLRTVTGDSMQVGQNTINALRCPAESLFLLASRH